MGGDRVANQRVRTGFARGRLLAIALASGLIGIAGFVRQDAPTSRNAGGVPEQQATLADQAVPVDGSAPSKGATPAVAHPPARGKTPPPSTRERMELISAARQSAVDDLLRAVESQPIRSDFTVKQLLDALGPAARSDLRGVLTTSPQIGGARFPSPGTAEVQLQAEGADIVDKLVSLTLDAGAGAPLPVAELEQRLSSWRGRTFTATGGSASSSIGPELRARPESLPPEWAGVSEEARRNAFLQARENAVSQFIEAVRPIAILEDIPRRSAESTGDVPAPDQKHERTPLRVHEALERGNIEQDARQWLGDRPVSRMRYTEDRQIEVRLALEPADWVEQLKVSLSRPELGLPEISDQDWDRFTARLSDRLGGNGAVGKAAAAETERQASPLALPVRPPQWTRETITVRASAAPAAAGGSAAKRKLLTQQAALDTARRELRERLEALNISDQQTLADLARTSLATRDVIEGFVRNAGIAAADYHEDGSVTVEVSVTPRSLWQALERRLVLPASVASHD